MYGEGARCYYSPELMLMFNQVYGTWHAWRFALIFMDVEFQTSEAEEQLNDQIKEEVKQMVDPADIQAYVDATRGLGYSGETALKWLQARKGLKLGQDKMYPDAMMKHHYPMIK